MLTQNIFKIISNIYLPLIIFLRYLSASESPSTLPQSIFTCGDEIVVVLNCAPTQADLCHKKVQLIIIENNLKAALGTWVI